MIDVLIDVSQRVGDSFVRLFSLLDRHSPLFLASSVLIAVVIYVLAARRGGAVPESLFAYLFPRAIWRQRSAKVDVAFALVNQALLPLWALAVLIGPPTLAGPVHDLLVEGGLFPPPLPLTWLTLGGIVLGSFLVADFTLFFGHWLQHRVGLLWEFHKVHHSAEVLTPVTALRMHPVDTIVATTLIAVGLGLFNGLVTALVDGAPNHWWLLGGNIVFLAFYAAAYHLRHSHIWLAYPVWLGRWLISPAQHQIHHSSEPRHWDRNMGFVLAVWDRLFGTLYVPQGREHFPLGLTDGEHAEYQGVARLFLLPVRKAWRLLTGGGAWPARGVVAGLAVFAAVPVLHADGGPVTPGPRPSLQLEELTWLEVEAAVADGFTTVLVPTGGVEQNGPHLVLGKHNYIVAHTSRQIADRLGKTLVAPVIAYVPQGDADAGRGHMAYPGTISVPEPVFEGILEGAARSLKAAGFRLIVFVGDSGGNQAGQATVAARLNQAWADDGVRVLHAGDYYLENGQKQWLLAQNEGAGRIGRHAGIRDTSELLAVHPAGVREDLRRALPVAEAKRLGVDGDPSRASAGRGERLLKLKVDAAVAQIATARGQQGEIVVAQDSRRAKIEALWRAAEAGDTARAQAVLAEGMHDASGGNYWQADSDPNGWQRTPLHIAAKNGHLAMVQLLLGEGAEVDAFTKYGDTPLHFAISHGHLGVAQALIDAGADLDADNDEGDNPRSLGTKMGITFK